MLVEYSSLKTRLLTIVICFRNVYLCKEAKRQIAGFRNPVTHCFWGQFSLLGKQLGKYIGKNPSLSNDHNCKQLVELLLSPYSQLNVLGPNSTSCFQQQHFLRAPISQLSDIATQLNDILHPSHLFVKHTDPTSSLDEHVPLGTDYRLCLIWFFVKERQALM